VKIAIEIFKRFKFLAFFTCSLSIVAIVQFAKITTVLRPLNKLTLR